MCQVDRCGQVTHKGVFTAIPCDSLWGKVLGDQRETLLPYPRYIDVSLLLFSGGGVVRLCLLQKIAGFGRF